MSQIFNVTRTDDGQYQVSDAGGHLVDGPFDTNAAAWKALERLDNSAGQVPRARKPKTVLWGKPEKGKSKKALKREKQIAARQEKQMRREAHKAVGWVRQIAAVKFDPVGERAYRDHKLGTFGAASGVKRIDPAVYLAEKAARGES